MSKRPTAIRARTDQVPRLESIAQLLYERDPFWRAVGRQPSITKVAQAALEEGMAVLEARYAPVQRMDDRE